MFFRDSNIIHPAKSTREVHVPADLKFVRHARVVAILIFDHERAGAGVQGRVLEAADSDGVLALRGVAGDLHVIVTGWR